MTLYIFLLLGLIVGSFLNVVLFRFETEETALRGRSRCNDCRRLIAWYDNIPLISFLFLRGKCRSCGSGISWQYPLVELSTALVFAAIGGKFFVLGSLLSAVETTLLLGLAAALIVIFVYDILHMEIPVSALMFAMLWTMFGLFFLWFFALPREAFLDSRLFDGLLGGAIAFSFFYAIVFFSKETWMGAGDAWLALVLGLVSGWQLVLPAFTIAFGSGALVGIALILFGKKEMQSRIPFGPFLSVTVLFMVFFGRMIGNWFPIFGWM